MPLELHGQRAHQLPRAVQEQPPARPRLVLARERGAQLRLRLRADAAHRREPTRRDRFAKLARRPRADRATKLDRPLRPEAEVAAEADQLRLHLALQLARAGDLTARDELLQHGRDSRSDPAERLDLALPEQVGDRCRERSDQLGRAAIGADGVVAGARQVQQGRVALERVRDLRVVEIGRHSPDSLRRVVQVCVLSGGVGGAKFVRGLVETLGDERVTAIVNVGDDLEVLGMYVSPDLDSVVYALAGIHDEERGWGRADETWNAFETVRAIGGESWFMLGDRDLGVHLVRTAALARGEPLSAVTAHIAHAFGVSARVLPASDD